MKHKPEPFKITQIVQWKKKNLLLINEEYQRGAVWTNRQEKLLIDSIFRGYPIPLFYFHFIKNEEGGLSTQTYEIIDGQQRINAIYKFVNNGFRLFDPKRDRTGLPRFLGQESCSWGGMTFEMLPQELKDKFLNTELHVNIIETENTNEVRELFVRLQSGLPLNAQEKRDAWPGELSKFIVNLAGKRPSVVGHPFWSELVYRGAEKRGSLRQACAQAFMTFYSRHQYGPEAFCGLESKQIDEFYRHHLDFDPNAPGSMAQRFRRILDEAYDLLRDGKRPPLRVHAALHTILLIDSLLDQFSPEWKAKFPKALDNFLATLASASKDETNEYWSQYGILARTGSTERESVYRRHEFFLKKMLESMLPLCRKDPKRDFSREERELLYFLRGKKCFICGAEVKWIDAEAHHNEPHFQGGPTSLDNAELVHRECHPRAEDFATPEVKQALETETTDLPWDVDDGTVSEHEQEQ